MIAFPSDLCPFLLRALFHLFQSVVASFEQALDTPMSQ